MPQILTRRRFFLIILALAAPVLVFLLLFCAYFWSNAGRVPASYGVSRSEVLNAMLQLRANSSRITQVGGRSDVVLIESKNRYVQVLDNYMANFGWKRADQMGAVHHFRKGQSRLQVHSLSLTSYFILNKLERQP